MPTSATTYEALLPAQRTAFDNLARVVAKERVAQLVGRSGSGKTTILRTLHDRLGGAILTTKEFIEASAEPASAGAGRDGLRHGARRRWRGHPAVLVDDFQLHRDGELLLTGVPAAELSVERDAPALRHGAATAAKRSSWRARAIPIAGAHRARAARVTIPQFRRRRLRRAVRGASRRDARAGARRRRRSTASRRSSTRGSCAGHAASRCATSVRSTRSVHHAPARASHGEQRRPRARCRPSSSTICKGLDDVLEALEANVILPLENTEVWRRSSISSRSAACCSPARPARARRRSAARSRTGSRASSF